MNTLTDELRHVIFKKACHLEMEERFSTSYRFQHGLSSLEFPESWDRAKIIVAISDFILNTIFPSLRHYDLYFIKSRGDIVIHAEKVAFMNDVEMMSTRGAVPRSPLESYLWSMAGLVLLD